MDSFDRITIDPHVCLGQATIRGMRLTVDVVLKMLGAGRSVTEVIQAYPELEEEDVRQAMQYAAWITREDRRGFPDLAVFRESQGASYPGNTILEMREEERLI